MKREGKRKFCHPQRLNMSYETKNENISARVMYRERESVWPYRSLDSLHK
jgi:hypothetical protein